MEESRAIGGYRVRSRLGWGGMGEVYLATATGPGGVERPVAIKLIRDLHQQKQEFIEMFLEEAKVSFLLTHGNVVQTYEIGQVDGHYFLVMEYVDGISLEGLLDFFRDRLGQPLPVPFALYIGAQVARGLDYAHTLADQQGRALSIVHRDVSPGNVLLSRDGQVKLSDFGLAKSSLRQVESQAGVIKGKLGYMAPEQLAGDGAVGPTADLYSLGVVLYEMLSGANPFGDLHNITPVQRFSRQVPPLAEAAPHLDREVVELVSRCLQHEPGGRFASARELGRAIDACLRQTGQGVSDYDLAEFIQRAQEVAEAAPQSPHPFDRALGMELQKVAGAGGLSTFTRVPSEQKTDRPPPAPRPGSTLPPLTVPRQRWGLVALAALVLVGGGIGLWVGFRSSRRVAALRDEAAESRSGDMASTEAPRDSARASVTPPSMDTSVAVGTLHVRPIPPGGQVRVAGRLRGTAPLSLSGLPAGAPIRVEIERAGYHPYDQQVTVEPGGTLTLQPQLRRLPRAAPRPRGKGTLSVNSDPWSIVHVDGARIRSTPLVQHPLVAGRHHVRLYNPVRKLSAERTVTIHPGRETRLSVELK